MTVYLTVAEVAEIHQIMIDQFGGASGLRDIGALESALFRPQSGYYADLIAEACALLESLAINHPFIDGNKRVAYASMEIFLLINGMRVNATQQQIYRFLMRQFETNQFELAALERWFRPRIVADSG